MGEPSEPGETAPAASHPDEESAEGAAADPEAQGDLGGDSEAAAAGQEPSLPAEDSLTGPLPGDEADDACPISPLSILEALLFVGNRPGAPLTAAQVAGVMRGVEPEEIGALVDQLNERYLQGGCPYQIVGESGGYRMALRPEFHGLRAKFYGRAREARLSQAAIDVLAVVAYCQPVTADDVARQRGRPSNHILGQLVRRQLLAIERTDEKPRKTLYTTTRRFLALFGLESLDDLPQAEELDKR